MARITYQDESITEYDDGTEEVRFTEEEWEVMLADSKYGYVCRLGHRMSSADHRFGSCLSCEAEAEVHEAEAYEGWVLDMTYDDLGKMEL